MSKQKTIIVTGFVDEMKHEIHLGIYGLPELVISSDLMIENENIQLAVKTLTLNSNISAWEKIAAYSYIGMCIDKC